MSDHFFLINRDSTPTPTSLFPPLAALPVSGSSIVSPSVSVSASASFSGPFSRPASSLSTFDFSSLDHQNPFGSSPTYNPYSSVFNSLLSPPSFPDALVSFFPVHHSQPADSIEIPHLAAHTIPHYDDHSHSSNSASASASASNSFPTSLAASVDLGTDTDAEDGHVDWSAHFDQIDAVNHADSHSHFHLDETYHFHDHSDFPLQPTGFVLPPHQSTPNPLDFSSSAAGIPMSDLNDQISEFASCLSKAALPNESNYTFANAAVQMQQNQMAVAASSEKKSEPANANSESSLDVIPSLPLPSLPLSATSCNRCRLRKRACNKNLPSCALCSQAGAECVYPEPRRRKATASHNSTPNQHTHSHAHHADPAHHTHKRSIGEMALSNHSSPVHNSHSHQSHSTSVASLENSPPPLVSTGSLPQKRIHLAPHFHNNYEEILHPSSYTRNNLYIRSYFDSMNSIIFAVLNDNESNIRSKYQREQMRIYQSPNDLSQMPSPTVDAMPEDVESHRWRLDFCTILAAGARSYGDVDYSSRCRQVAVLSAQFFLAQPLQLFIDDRMLSISVFRSISILASNCIHLDLETGRIFLDFAIRLISEPAIAMQIPRFMRESIVIVQISVIPPEQTRLRLFQSGSKKPLDPAIPTILEVQQNSDYPRDRFHYLRRLESIGLISHFTEEEAKFYAYWKTKCVLTSHPANVVPDPKIAMFTPAVGSSAYRSPQDQPELDFSQYRTEFFHTTVLVCKIWLEWARDFNETTSVKLKYDSESIVKRMNAAQGISYSLYRLMRSLMRAFHMPDFRGPQRVVTLFFLTLIHVILGFRSRAVHFALRCLDSAQTIDTRYLGSMSRIIHLPTLVIIEWAQIADSEESSGSNENSNSKSVNPLTSFEFDHRVDSSLSMINEIAKRWASANHYLSHLQLRLFERERHGKFHGLVDNSTILTHWMEHWKSRMMRIQEETKLASQAQLARETSTQAFDEAMNLQKISQLSFEADQIQSIPTKQEVAEARYPTVEPNIKPEQQSEDNSKYFDSVPAILIGSSSSQFATPTSATDSSQQNQPSSSSTWSQLSMALLYSIVNSPHLSNYSFDQKMALLDQQLGKILANQNQQIPNQQIQNQ